MATHYRPGLSKVEYPRFLEAIGGSMPATDERFVYEQSKEVADIRDTGHEVCITPISFSAFETYCQHLERRPTPKDLENMAF